MVSDINFRKFKFRSLFLVILFVLVIFAATASAQTFTNPISPLDYADPWVIYKDGYYYYVGSNGDNEIYVWKSQSLTGILSGTKVTVWKAPATGMNSKQIWAPELHFINGKWYIYYAASDGNNANHRMWVLEATGSDPQGTYASKGKIADSTDKWAIDGTVLQKTDGSLYFIWSGWPGDSDGMQNLYIAPMSDPWTISGERKMISTPTYDWECRGMCLQEGPTAIHRNGKIFIVFSSSGSWKRDYNLGLLTNTDGNVLNPGSWSKTGPVFREYSNVYGVGHASFVKSPDQTEDWIVYHAKTVSTDGWSDRNIRVQKFTWNADDSPNFGLPIPAGVAMDVPSGENGPYGWGSSSSGTAVSGTWNYYSTSSASNTSLGSGWFNIFRGDVKLTGYTVEAQAKWVQSGTTSSYPKYGIYASYKNSDNYVVAFLDKKYGVLATHAVVGGASQGWQNTSLSIDFSQYHTIKVVKTNDQFEFYIDGALKQTRYFNISNGQIGLVTEDTKADYQNVKVTDISNGWGDSFASDKKTGNWQINSFASATGNSLGSGWKQLFRGNPNFESYTVSASLKWLETGTTASYPKYGIYASYKDSSNYVVAFLDKKYHAFATYAVVNGTGQGWQNTALPTGFDFSQYHTIEVDKGGTSFNFYLDGTLLQRRFFDIINNGQIGLVTEDTKADYMNVSVRNNIGWGNSSSGTLASGSYVPISRNEILARFVGAYWKEIFTGNVSRTDYTVEARLKWIETGTTSPYPKYGVYATYKDGNNYVSVWLDKKYRVFSTYAVVGGASQGWQNTTLPTGFDYSQFHNVKVIKSGSTFQFYLDGSLKQTRSINISNGQIGIVTDDTKADYFDVITY
jgi:GH43 family beta-xylosidase